MPSAQRSVFGLGPGVKMLGLSITAALRNALSSHPAASNGGVQSNRFAIWRRTASGQSSWAIFCRRVENAENPGMVPLVSVSKGNSTSSARSSVG